MGWREGTAQAIAMIQRIEKGKQSKKNSHYRKPSKAILEMKILEILEMKILQIEKPIRYKRKSVI